MNRFRVFVFVALAVVGCSSAHQSTKSISEDAYSKYQSAYDAVASDSELLNKAREVFEDNSLATISVSLQIVYMDYWSFRNQISQLKNIAETPFGNYAGAMSDSLLRVDELRYIESHYDQNLQDIAQSSEDNLVLFFSVPYKNSLLAELFHLDDLEKSHEEATSLATGIRLLFFFD